MISIVLDLYVCELFGFPFGLPIMMIFLRNYTLEYLSRIIFLFIFLLKERFHTLARSY